MTLTHRVATMTVCQPQREPAAIRATPVHSGDLYLAHRTTIEQAIRAVCRRHRLRPEDAEDFASNVRIHLMDNDFAVLRRFRGRSSMGTYLLAVVTHLAQDWRNALWGKWRPSAEAQRQGPIATQLERLMRRECLTFEQAYETLRTNFRVTKSRADLEAIASGLPARTWRRFVPDCHLEESPAAIPGPDVLADRRDAATEARHVAVLLMKAISSLSPQDALLLKFRFQDGLRVVDIARSLRLEEKPLYRRLTRLLTQLRKDLEQQGLTAWAARDLLIRQGLDDLDEARFEIHRDVRLFPRRPTDL